MRPDLWIKYAARNLRSGLKGFWIFLSCLTLGVAAIAMIGSLASAVQQGLNEQGQNILGGDVEFSIVQRQASADELDYMKSKGELSQLASMRAMAQSNGASTLVEIKAIDQAYPLYGTLKLAPQSTDTFSSLNGSFGVAVDPLLLDRLHLKLGDTLKLGQAEVTLRATIDEEPDRLANGIIFGPRLMMSHEAMQATGSFSQAHWSPGIIM